MLTLILGRAGNGKSSYIFNRLSALVEKREEGNILIVPEQYSHDAERALAASCGDSASLYAEVLSFSRLCSRVFAQTGGMAEKTLDNGGRVLSMSLAAASVSDRLKVYNVGGRRPDFVKNLISAYDELRSSCADGAELSRMSDGAPGNLGDKLSDLVLIFEAYDTIKEKSGCDARDKLDRLAGSICESMIGDSGKIFIDGFTDFTAQEFRVIEQLMKKDADITVCLTCGRLDDPDMLFRLQIKTAQRLISAASKNGIKAEIATVSGAPQERAPALRFLEKHLMEYGTNIFDGDSGCISVYAASGISEECSIAASKAAELVRAGCRFRDIAVVSPKWDSYDSIARGVFAKYGIPISLTEKSDILEKPVMSVITSALDIITENWDYINVFKYLKTGMSGMALMERDVLENYVLKWSIRGESMWNRAGGWTMHPDGYSTEMSGQEQSKLALINALRERIVSPIAELHSTLIAGESALSKVRAVYSFMENIGLYETLNDKAQKLENAGNRELAEEYRQLWDIVLNALQQFADILGDTLIGIDEFIRLFKLVLSQYQVGVIPTSVDSVHAGDMSRVRARGIKHLIVLGATDDSMPARERKSGIFSDDEREKLRDMGLELIDSDDDLLSRELCQIYLALTVPSESLTLSYPSASGRRSYVLSRIEKLFDIGETPAGNDVYTSAKLPCFEFAASCENSDARSAREYFESSDEWRGRLDAVKRAAAMPRGRLSRITAEKIYGREINVSASRIDKYYSCRFSYFLRYGLLAKPRTQAALDAPETGTFMHFILERSAKSINEKGGFSKVTEEDICKIVPAFVKEYAEKKLGGLENKSGRFKFLFKRLSLSAVQVVISMAEELKNSQFRPLDFELKFARGGDLAPVKVSDNSGSVSINGVVDRVDGWIKDDNLYLRVIDYKTGKKALSLSDIWYGMGMQMLIYLFALQRVGSERYGKNIIPAGVLYTPARDVLTQAPHDLSDDELKKESRKNMKRSGLLLCDPEVLEAMESRENDTGLLPVRFTKDGVPTGDSLASLDKLGKLAERVDELIADMGREIRSGSIAADPYFRGQLDNACTYCEYFEACHFKDGTGGDRARYLSRLKTPEFWQKLEEAEK